MFFALGRHLRLPSGTKLIVARNEGEVRFLQGFRNRYSYAYRKDGKGTLALIKGRPSEEELKLIADIIARYSKNQACEVLINLESREVCLYGEPISEDLVESLKIFNKKGAKYET